MSRWRSLGARAGVTGVAVGVMVGGAAAGFAARRLAHGFRSAPSRRAEAGGTERYGTLRDTPRRVTATDGTGLHVEIREGDETPVTVVFCHGYALNQDSWHCQRRDLAGLGRLVFWDQRGHGRSGRGAVGTATIDQLGKDLEAVVSSVAPEGPIVLVGHSMGGMTIMALADRRPELFGSRVVGVALISTSASALGQVSLGIPAYTARILHRVAPGLMSAMRHQPALVERGRRAGGDLVHVLTKRYAFASDVPQDLVAFAAGMLQSTPIDVVAEFFPAFENHDRLATLPVLRDVETLVVVGADDVITPPAHSEEMARLVPGSELVVVPEAGHLVMLECPDAVNRHLRGLVEHALRRGGRKR